MDGNFLVLTFPSDRPRRVVFGIKKSGRPTLDVLVVSFFKKATINKILLNLIKSTRNFFFFDRVEFKVGVGGDKPQKSGNPFGWQWRLGLDI